MFTGIIEDIGQIDNISKKDKFYCFKITTSIISGTINEGDSISVNGICLTASKTEKNSFSAEVSPETVKKTNLLELTKGDRVNLERAVTPETRLGGHIVSGHIDGTGNIKTKERLGEGFLFSIKTSKDILRYVVKNGSITIDGISLTIISVDSTGFKLMIVPHTLLKTVLDSKKQGNSVNIEVDILGKYIEKFLITDNQTKKEDNISFSFLAKNGYM